MAKEIDAGGVTQGVSRQLWKAIVRVLQAADGEPASLRLLDCGGGSGSLAVPLAGLGAHVTVVDISVDALGTLVRRATEAGVADRIVAVQGEIENLDVLLAGQRFQVVFAHEVLESCADIDAVLGQVRSVLLPGGTVSILVRNRAAVVLGRVLVGDVQGAVRLVGGHSAAAEPVTSSITLATLVDICRRSDLEPLLAEGIGVFTDLVRGAELDRPGATVALDQLEELTCDQAPYRDIAARLHLLARWNAS